MKVHLNLLKKICYLSKKVSVYSILLIGQTVFSQENILNESSNVIIDSLKKSKWFTLHAQETTVSQFRPKFNASYSGAHSQIPIDEWGTTITSTIYLGLKLWKNAQIIINPEIAGGHGLSFTYGIAAFTNGEVFRVGNPDPTYFYLIYIS